ncbi:MAG: hydrogenase maturation nickel metallochaperone HypA [Acidobacteriia bacterium]|nr:hydrogenase maturation nickel metallochaperone HypA [Terriglobia bacterium]
MHEMGIANSVLDAVRHESEIRQGARVLKVGVRVGELAAVDPESLRFCFEALVSGSDLEPLVLDLEYCPRRNRCRHCGEIFPATEFPFTCPQCNSEETVLAGGDELEFAYMEIEET